MNSSAVAPSIRIDGPPPTVELQSRDLPPEWEARLDTASGRLFFFNAETQTSQWHRPGSVAIGSTRLVGQKPDPYPQVLEAEAADLLVVAYPQVADDSKPDLADHQFVSPQATVLQAPAVLS